jgi:hypothetical protein
MSNFPLPKGYQRMGAFPLDETAVFPSLVALTDYAQNNGSAYAGQLCTVNDGVTVTVYKVNVDKTVTVIGLDGTLDLGSF